MKCVCVCVCVCLQVSEGGEGHGILPVLQECAPLFLLPFLLLFLLPPLPPSRLFLLIFFLFFFSLPQALGSALVCVQGTSGGLSRPQFPGL